MSSCVLLMEMNFYCFYWINMIRNCLLCAKNKLRRRRRGVEEFNCHSVSNYNLLWRGHSSLPLAGSLCRIIDRLIRGADTTFIQLSNFINWSSAVSGLVLVLFPLFDYFPLHPRRPAPNLHSSPSLSLPKCGWIKANCNRTPGRRSSCAEMKIN